MKIEYDYAGLNVRIEATSDMYEVNPKGFFEVVEHLQEQLSLYDTIDIQITRKAADEPRDL